MEQSSFDKWFRIPSELNNPSFIEKLNLSLFRLAFNKTTPSFCEIEDKKKVRIKFNNEMLTHLELITNIYNVNQNDAVSIALFEIKKNHSTYGVCLNEATNIV
uniref:Uncharacterized protein n=1 Tax=Enterovibrio norvegicus TaxID=188144 RepID=A0A0H4A0Z3_9GAMM|nr:hypothetical protein [Enterovibrio norvegicus]